MESNIKKESERVHSSTAYQQKVRSSETKHHLISFSLMIALTALAFFAVVSETIPSSFALPFILFLAVIQVFLQLGIFMHMNQKGHEYPIWFILSGIFAAILTVAGITYLIWW